VSRYIDEHRGRFGVGPICQTLGVSASAYYQRKSGTRSASVLEDGRLIGRIRELQAANYFAFGYRRMRCSASDGKRLTSVGSSGDRIPLHQPGIALAQQPPHLRIVDVGHRDHRVLAAVVAA